MRRMNTGNLSATAPATGLTMTSNFRSPTFVTASRRLAIFAGIVFLAGCEQMKSPGYYDPPRESTTTDAIRQAETGGTRQVLQAPSQIQLKIARPGPQDTSVPAPTANEGDRLTAQGQTAMAAADAQQAGLNKLISQPQTYQGTLPCFHKDMRCTNQRITLTVAPNGRWRARASYLENDAQSGKAFATQGCWRIVPTTPPNLVLLDADGRVRSEMLFVSRNTLRLKSIDGETPNLTYTLNRQPDLDPIAELDKTAAPSCN